MKLRIAFSGSSGTGKTTLATFIAETFNLPMNPIGSRSVAKAMGFESPYDVDKAGKRAEFQQRIAIEKIAWEAAHEEFVSDRTTLDNLAYTILHDVRTIDQSFLSNIVRGMERYTHVLYCPVEVFCQPGGDTARVQDLIYHRVYDDVLNGLFDRYSPPKQAHHPVTEVGLERRKAKLKDYFEMVRGT